MGTLAFSILCSSLHPVGSGVYGRWGRWGIRATGVSPPEEAGVVQRPEWCQGGHWAPDLAGPSVLMLHISLAPLRWHAT